MTVKNISDLFCRKKTSVTPDVGNSNWKAEVSSFSCFGTGDVKGKRKAYPKHPYFAQPYIYY
jgi:hypothetical protein